MATSSREKAGLASAAAGVGLALGAAALGAYIQTRKTKDRAPDDAPGFTARRSFGKYEVVGRTVTIRRPRSELYAFWRDFQNLAHVMENVERIQPTGGDGRAVWTIRAPAGQTVDVETEIAREVENEIIAWRSVAGSDVDTEGRVMFEDGYAAMLADDDQVVSGFMNKLQATFADILPDQLVAQMHRRLTEPDAHKAREEARKEAEHA